MDYKDKAFTLVELLVVIAIIAMLLAILSPVLSKVKEQGRSLVCKSQLRQIGQGLLTYAANNKERLVPGELNGYFIQASHQPVNIGHLLTDNYLPLPDGRNNVFYCPANKLAAYKGDTASLRMYDFYRNWNNPMGSGHVTTGYLYRDAMDDYTPSFDTNAKGVLASKVGKFPIMTEQPVANIIPWHRGRLNAVFGDGHVADIDLNNGSGSVVLKMCMKFGRSTPVTGNTYFLWLDEYWVGQRFEYPQGYYLYDPSRGNVPYLKDYKN